MATSKLSSKSPPLTSLDGSPSVIPAAFPSMSFYHHSVAQYLPKSAPDVNHAENNTHVGRQSPAIRPLPPPPFLSPTSSHALAASSVEKTLFSDPDLSQNPSQKEGTDADEPLGGPHSSPAPSNLSSSPTPSLSSSSTHPSPHSISSDSCLPATPSSTDPKFPRGPRPRSFSNERENSRSGGHRRTLSEPNILHPQEVDGAKTEWVSRMENESAIDWYSNEFSDTITVGSQLPLSIPARPDSVSFAPRSPAVNAGVRVAKPLPSIPALRPNRGNKASPRSIHPADVLRSELATVGENEDAVADGDSADAGLVRGAGDGLGATGDGHVGDETFIHDEPPADTNLPLPLPHDPIDLDLELEIATHLEELSSHRISSLSPARPDTPTDSMYGEMDHKHLRSRWSVSTHASTTDDEKGFFRGSAFLRFNFRPQKKSRGMSVLM